MEYDLDKEERAYALLQWGSPAQLAPFNEELAMQGFYSAIQKQRSDAALDEWDKSHPYETSSELAAFKELESIGALTQADFYSPAKASRKPNGLSNSSAPQTSYLDDLKQFKSRDQSVQESSTTTGQIRTRSRSRLSRERLAISDEESGSTSTG